MLHLLFTFYLWIIGIVVEDNPVKIDEFAARARCRQISVDNVNCVRVKFMNREDAEIFAEQLKRLINEN